MPRPGVTIELVRTPSGQAVLNSGQSFFIGVAERGRLEAIRVGSVADYTRAVRDRAGGRSCTTASARTSARVAPPCGSPRSPGPARSPPPRSSPDNVAAAGTGEWGNDLTVEAVDATATGGTGAVQIVVTYDGRASWNAPRLSPPPRGRGVLELGLRSRLTTAPGISPSVAPSTSPVDKTTRPSPPRRSPPRWTGSRTSSGPGRSRTPARRPPWRSTRSSRTSTRPVASRC